MIPFECFGGDGMLTRLLLKASEQAPWSDNGLMKHEAILPVENLEKGKYFYEVMLDGTPTDKQALLEHLKANGQHTYMATVKVYAANQMLIAKDGIYFIVLVTILASGLGFLVSWLLLGNVFRSLEKLKRVIKTILQKRLIV